MVMTHFPYHYCRPIFFCSWAEECFLLEVCCSAGMVSLPKLSVNLNRTVYSRIRFLENNYNCSLMLEVSINGHLHTTDTSKKRTNIIIPMIVSLLKQTSTKRTPLNNGQLHWSNYCPLYGGTLQWRIKGIQCQREVTMTY